MTLELVTVPCLSDNYAYLLHNAATGETAIVDFPEAPPLLLALSQRGWTPTHGFITHHHPDHIQGLEGVLAVHPNMTVIGAKADAHRLPALTIATAEGETIDALGTPWHVLDVSGHTIGHIAFHLPKEKIAFTADSLMALGCGRLFEGTPAMMWLSMQKLMALPPETLICSGHEYTLGNACFAVTIETDNQDLLRRAADTEAARARGEATVPSLLSLELATNPFLRVEHASVAAALGMETSPPAARFGELRERKNRF